MASGNGARRWLVLTNVSTGWLMLPTKTIDASAFTWSRPRANDPERHIVLHDLDASIVLEADSGDLIEGHYIPEPNQSNSSAGQVVKQVCNGGLPP